ncbi:hypothetical protein HPB49_019616 [Dermacentor silvarum]|uniref:Uncharacterized protein n=1 Tax=Dermacentor silvarum TaxID=543639 RepID=A0ACB8CAX9_DERSI|nr:hypothetical protein HPB49_019616 [Dermacentor silvarum]
MDSGRWRAEEFSARFHPDLTAISEQPSEEIVQRDAFERLKRSSEPVNWSTGSGVSDQGSSHASEKCVKARTRRSERSFAEQVPQRDGRYWFHPPPPLPDSGHFDVNAYSEERRSLSAYCDFHSSLPEASYRASDSKDGDQLEQATPMQHVHSPVQHRGHQDPFPRYVLATFLTALAVVCAAAVFVDIKWRAQDGSDQSPTVSHGDAPATASVADNHTEKHHIASLRSTTISSATPVPRMLGKKYFAPSSVSPLMEREMPEHGASVTAFSATDAVEFTSRKTKGHVITRRHRFASGRLYTNYSKRLVTTTPHAFASKSRPHVLSAPIQKPANHRCGVAFYTYCSETRHDVYYQHATRSCVPTLTDHVQVCNHSPNRFATLQACQQSCIHSELPSESCFERTLFAWCRRQDVSATWWSFDGKHCRPWHFPKGLCPDFAEADVFASQHECMRRCFPLRRVSFRRQAGRRRSAPCRRPKAGTVCDVDVVKFPYFADISPGNGRVRCLKSSASHLLDHRCLVGSNRFLSETACKRTCVDSGPGKSPKYILA